MTFRNSILFPIFGLLALVSCEDIIEVELDDAQVSLVVDAWLDNSSKEQKIVLQQSQGYFNSAPPLSINNAKVDLIRNGQETISFSSSGAGQYIWVPGPGETLGKPGDQFELIINIAGDIYRANSSMNRVPVIDSIAQEFRDDEVFLDDGIYAQFYARDFSGTGDTYWIKTYKNGSYLNKAVELNIAYDAGFDAGTGIDGLVFIPPIRDLINENDSDGIPQPYVPGDHIRVELYSIEEEAFNFLEIVRDQLNNGNNGIFAFPLANARTNIVSENSKAVLGFFSTAAVSVMEKTIE